MGQAGGAGRRKFFLQLGMVPVALGASSAAHRVLASDREPKQGIIKLEGTATLNGAPASLGMPVRPGDVVKAGANSQVIVVMDRDAFLIRANSEVQLGDAKRGDGFASVLRVVTGGILSVFAKKPHQVVTPTVTIGIRGTGVYVEVAPERSYVCTCYGEVDMTSGTGATESVSTTYHEAARFIDSAASGGKISPAPFLNHSDAELALLEALVDRTPPFAGQTLIRY